MTQMSSCFGNINRTHFDVGSSFIRIPSAWAESIWQILLFVLLKKGKNVVNFLSSPRRRTLTKKPTVNLETKLLRDHESTQHGHTNGFTTQPTIFWRIILIMASKPTGTATWGLTIQAETEDFDRRAIKWGKRWETTNVTSVSYLFWGKIEKE